MQRNVRDILIEKINAYLDGNKAPEGLLATVGSVFSSSGKDGRIRAQKVLLLVQGKIDDVSDNSEQGFELITQKKEVNGSDADTDKKLVVSIYREIVKSDSALLGSSTVLRERLVEGLCEHFGITDEQTKNEEYNVYVRNCQGSTSNPYLPSFHEGLYVYPARLSLLQPHINKVTEINNRATFNNGRK